MARKKKVEETQAVSEEYMNEEHQAHFRAMLTKLRDEIIASDEASEKLMREEREHTADLNDRATQEEEFYLEIRTRDRERRLLDKVNKALLRLDRHEFGWCEDCGGRIGLNRLNARPTAELCIACKEIAEHKEKSYYR